MDMTGRLALRPAEFAEAIGVSRSKAYELIKSGEVPSVTIGGITRVPVAAALELIARKLSEARPGGV
jgi:excisionase family DNA binding protein